MSVSRLKDLLRPTADDEWWDISESNVGILLVLPLISVLLLIFVYPILTGFWFSLHEVSLFLSTMEFIQFENYQQIVRNSEFHRALVNTVVYTTGSVLIALIIGVGGALLVNQVNRGKRLVTGLILTPYLVPTVGTVFLFRWVFNAQNGILNYLLVASGVINHPITFLGSRTWAMGSLLVISGWRLYPFVTLLVLAKLQTIPESYYEAADLMGASVWAKFRYVTLPQLKGVLFVAILLRILWTFNLFDIIWLGTGGGPARSTETLIVMAYRVTFQGYELGLGSALAVIAFIVLAIGTLVYWQRFNSSEAI